MDTLIRGTIGQYKILEKIGQGGIAEIYKGFQPNLNRYVAIKVLGRTLRDDERCMRVSLRDFRPFVPQLLAVGEDGLANLLPQDYLTAYVQGLNRFVLGDIIAAREA